LLRIIIGKIRAAGAGHPLAPIADALDEINRYCRRYHAENPNAANESIDDAELNTYVKRPLQLAGFLARLGPFASAGNDSTRCAYKRRCAHGANRADVEEPNRGHVAERRGRISAKRMA